MNVHLAGAARAAAAVVAVVAVVAVLCGLLAGRVEAAAAAPAPAQTTSRPATRPAPVVIEKTARETLTAVEMNRGDELRFTLSDGTTRSIVLRKTWARVTHTTTTQPKVAVRGAVTNYRFSCILEIDGHSVQITREVASQRSFYEPREFMGLRIWFDACDDIFNFLNEDHGECRPRKHARFAIQEAGKGGRRIAPVLLHPWCPLPAGGLRVEDCYDGADVWLGAFFGAEAHGGLDINHPAGTPIWTPIAIDDHVLFNSLAAGDNNNRWRGFHRWADGSTWVLQVHHLIRLRVKEHEPIPAGALLADGAGVYVGDHEHSHFVFKVIEPGGTEADAILLDPWILFWQMYRDREATAAKGKSE
jgi:hypothetical protein